MPGRIPNRNAKAIEKAYVNVNPDEEPMWTKDENLVSWLKKF